MRAKTSPPWPYSRQLLRRRRLIVHVGGAGQDLGEVA